MQVDSGENHVAECLKESLNDVESQAGVSTQLSVQADVPADSGHDADLVLCISELADRYWNGPRSLLNNQQFKSWHQCFNNFTRCLCYYLPCIGFTACCYSMTLSTALVVP